MAKEKSKYKLLDLFCGGGGCSKGYSDAGFEVTGVDINPHPNYPYTFIQDDAIKILNDEDFIKQFDVIAASCPCQKYSRLKHLSGNVEKWEESHVDLVEPTRELFKYYEEKYGIPYVIENVVGAPLINPIKLCGSQFEGLYTQRPRLFESSIKLKEPSVQVRSMGTGKLGAVSENLTMSVCGNRNLKGFNATQTKLLYGVALGGIDWMTLEELTQAIPPVYAQFIGEQLIEYLDKRNVKQKINTEQITFNNFDIDEFVKLVMSYI